MEELQSDLKTNTMKCVTGNRSRKVDINQKRSSSESVKNKTSKERFKRTFEKKNPFHQINQKILEWIARTVYS